MIQGNGFFTLGVTLGQQLDGLIELGNRLSHVTLLAQQETQACVRYAELIRTLPLFGVGGGLADENVSLVKVAAKPVSVAEGSQHLGTQCCVSEVSGKVESQVVAFDGRVVGAAISFDVGN
jgi:hypothetical protein